MEIISHLLAISGVLVLVSLLYNLGRVRIVSNKNNGILPPEPSGALPIIGHIHKFLGKIPMFRIMAAMADKHGPTFMFRFGMKRALVKLGLAIMRQSRSVSLQTTRLSHLVQCPAMESTLFTTMQHLGLHHMEHIGERCES